MPGETFRPSESVSDASKAERLEVLKRTRKDLNLLAADVRESVTMALDGEGSAMLHEEQRQKISQAVARIALQRLNMGVKETRGKDRGPLLPDVTIDNQDGYAWCASFALRCWKDAYDSLAIPVSQRLLTDVAQVRRLGLLSAANLEKFARDGGFYKANNDPTLKIAEGMLVFTRASTRSGRHVGVVTEVRRDDKGKVVSITSTDGNINVAPRGSKRVGGVGQIIYRVNSPSYTQITGFALPLRLTG